MFISFSGGWPKLEYTDILISEKCIYTKNSIGQKRIQSTWLPTNQVIYHKRYFRSFVIIVFVLQSLTYISKTFGGFKVVWDW